MDFHFQPEDETFRAELRECLKENRPPDSAGAHFAVEFFSSEDGEEFERRIEWHKRLYEGRWIAIHWPKEHGGRGASLVQQIIYEEELARVGAPRTVNGQGLGLVGPTLMQWGTAEQRHRYLQPMMSAAELWCQGYSEPGAGSDLGSLQTRAVDDADDFVVSGQKIWTSNAHQADMCFLLVQTDPDAPKHKGITYLLVDMHSPGISIRPLLQMTGDRGFNEVFFDSVRVPKKNIVGERNNGWLVAMTSLMYERRAPDMTSVVDKLLRIVASMKAGGSNAWRDSSVRQKLMRLRSEAEAIRLTGLRQLTQQLKGRPPGPEGSILKLGFSELNVRLNNFAMELLGPYGQIEYQAARAIDDGRWSYRMLAARGLTIAAGTSEIQKNIIGERILGLPRG
jgi:alkylation response protein AidB-like acyl-CoA dehydrogenase